MMTNEPIQDPIFLGLLYLRHLYILHQLCKTFRGAGEKNIRRSIAPSVILNVSC